MTKLKLVFLNDIKNMCAERSDCSGCEFITKEKDKYNNKMYDVCALSHMEPKYWNLEEVKLNE